MSKREYDMATSYVQACWECGITPSKRTFKKIKRQQQERNWSIKDLNRNDYEED